MKSSEILAEVKSILSAAWQLNPGRTVPQLERVKLAGNHGVQIEGTVLYADMEDSTRLVDHFKAEFAAEIYKSFLYGACKIVVDHDGEVTAFDGDRVMAVFMGSVKNTNAVKTALKLNYLVRQINKAIAAQYPKTSYALGHKVGIDTSSILVAKTGIRDYNDLVWVGPAANYAAKLAALSEDDCPTYISEATYGKLHETAKFSEKVNMWEKRNWTATGRTIYRTNYYWKF